MPIDWESRRVKEPIDWESRRVKGPITEDEGMELVTRQADVGYEQDKPGVLEAASRSYLTGGSFGGYHKDAMAKAISMATGEDVDVILDRMERKERMGREEHPITTTVADLVGGVVSGFIPGIGPLGSIQKGLKGAQYAKGLAKASGQMAGLGAAEGYRRSGAEDTVGKLKDAGTSAVISGAVPGGLQALGKTGKIAKGMLPGTTGAPKSLNKMVSQASRLGGVNPVTARNFEELLNNPERLKKAIDPTESVIDEIPEVNQRLSEAFDAIDGKVSEVYRKHQAEAFSKNVEDIDDFTQHLNTAKQYADTLMAKASDQRFYAPRTRNAIERVRAILNFEDPDIGDLAKKFEDIQKRAELGEDVAEETQEALRKLGGSITKAKRELKGDIKWAGTEFRNRDSEDLQTLYNQLNELTHGPTGGAADMKKADDLYTNYMRKAKPFMERFTGRGPEGLSSKKVGDFINEAGSKYTQAETKAYEKASKKFFDEFGLSESGQAIDNALSGLQHWKDQAALTRLGGQTGEQTGRSVLTTIPAIGALAATGNLPIAAIVGAISTPIGSPGKYLKGLNMARDVIKKVGESEAAKMFGEHWPKVKSAVARQYGAAKGEDLEKELDKNSSKISPNVRDAVKSGSLSPGDRSKTGAFQLSPEVKQRIQGMVGNMVPQDSTLAGRSQLSLDNLIGADKIGLDPGEKPSASQPSASDEKYLSMVPFMPAGTVTKLSPAVRKRLLEKRRKEQGGDPRGDMMKDRIESGPKKEVFSKNEINFNDWARANYDEDIIDQVSAELGSLGGIANIKNKDLGERIDDYRDMLKDLKDPKYEFNRRGLGMTPESIQRRKEVLDLKIKILLNESAERMGKTFRPKKDK